MAMTVKRRKDTSTKKVIQHRIADIRGGVGVKVSELAGDVLLEGTPLSAPVNGLVSVVKTGVLTKVATESDTSYEVEKNHHFKVGDHVANVEKGVSATITAIDKSGANKDIITLSATLGTALVVGDTLFQAAAASANDAALKYIPQSIAGTTYPIVQGDNIFVDAWVIAVTKGNNLPAAVATALKGIINI